MIQPISRYRVRIESRAHGTFTVETTATSAEQAARQVREFEGCPASCVTAVEHVRTLLGV